MQNKVTIRGELPRIVEDAKTQQILNRQQLHHRKLKDDVEKDVARRSDIALRKGLTTGIKDGGQLEFGKRQVRKIRVTPRALERGFLLLPNSGFDNQGRIYVRSAYGANPYAQASPSEYNISGFNLFEVANGRLEPKLNVGIDPGLTDGNSGLSYKMPPTYQSATSFTLEFFMYLQGSNEIPGYIEPVEENIYLIQESQCYLDLTLSSQENGEFKSYASFHANKNKDFPFTPIPGVDIGRSFLRGIGPSWQASTSVFDNYTGIGNTTGTYHVAMINNNGILKVYFAGNLIFEAEPDIVKGIIPISFSLSAYSTGGWTLRKFAPGSPVGGEVIDFERLLAPVNYGISSIRFTPGEALYSGTSFTPPISITDLA